MRKFFGYFSEISIFTLVGLILIAGPLNFGSRPLSAQGLLQIAAVLLLPLWMIRLVCLAEPVFVWTKITLPLLAFFAYACIWYLFCAVKWQARQEILMLACYLILFLIVVNNLQRRWQLQSLFWIIAGVAAAEAADGIFRYYHGQMNTACRFFFFDCVQRQGAQNVTRAGGTFFTPDHFAACLEIAFVLIAAHLVILKRSWTRKIFLGYLGTWVLVGIALSRSRGGWITLLCSVPFLVFLVVRGKFLNFRSAIVGMLVLIGVVYLLYSRHGLVAERLEDLIEHGEESRMNLYQSALKMAAAHPIFGLGPRMFVLHFPKYHYQPEDPDFAHSEFLQVLADYGIVGVALVGWLFFALARSALQMTAPKQSEHGVNVSSELSQRLAFAAGGTAAMFAITVHAAFDFVWHVMGIGVTLATVAGLMYAGAALRKKRNETDLAMFGFENAYKALPLSPKQQYVVLGVLGAAFLWLLPMSVKNYLPIVYLEAGEKLLHSEFEVERDRSFDYYRRAIKIDPRNYRIAFALANAYYQKGTADPENNKPMLEQALRWYAETVRLNPYSADAYRARAQYYFDALEPDKARLDCEKLVAVSPYNPSYRFLYGQVCFMVADYECARRELQTTLDLIGSDSDQLEAEVQSLLDLVKDAPRPEDPDSN